MKILKFGFTYYKRYMPYAIAALLMSFTITAIWLLFPQISKIIVDYVILPADTSLEQSVPSAEGNIFAFMLSGSYGGIGTIELLIHIALLSVCLMATRHLLTYARNNFNTYYAMKFEASVRDITFNKLFNIDSFALSRYNTGEVMTILNSDTTLFREIFIRSIPSIFDSLLMIALAVYYLYGIYPPLCLLPFTVMPVQVFLFVRYIRRAKVINRKIRDNAAKLSMNVQENINGVRIVRSFAAENYEIKKFQQSSAQFRDSYFDQLKFTTKYHFGFNFVRHILYLACVLAGSIFAINKKITVGDFTAFISYVFMILDSTINIVNLIFEAQHYTVSGERIYNFVNAKNTIKNVPLPTHVLEKPNIKVDGVSLTIENQLIFKNISIDIPYGKKLGVMGGTASGKTSLFKLLIRSLETSEGSIYINGIDIKEIEIDNLRRQYSYCPQDVFLFSNTVDSNIAFYNPDMPKETVMASAEIACTHGFIKKLSNGYETVIGERGVGLSGGQKQRISAARAFAKDAPILLLDDITSALDAETEKCLLDNVYSKFGDRTIIISAHRASAFRYCDEIIVLGGGGIAERGTHKELMEAQGIYYNTVMQQIISLEE